MLQNMSGSYKVYRYAATEHLPSTACLLQLLLRLLLLLLLVWLLSVCTVTVCITIVIVTPVPKLPPPVKDAAFYTQQHPKQQHSHVVDD
jgi:hypothetical protein